MWGLRTDPEAQSLQEGHVFMVTGLSNPSNSYFLSVTQEIQRVGQRLLSFGQWRLSFGQWLLSFGQWPLSFGQWRLSLLLPGREQRASEEAVPTRLLPSSTVLRRQGAGPSLPNAPSPGLVSHPALMTPEPALHQPTAPPPTLARTPPPGSGGQGQLHCAACLP